MPEVPYLTKVAANSTFAEKLSLPLPLLINYPYRGADGTTPESSTKTQSKSMAFSIGYAAASEAELGLEAIPGTAFYRIAYGSGITHQKILTGPLVTARLTLQG